MNTSQSGARVYITGFWPCGGARERTVPHILRGQKMLCYLIPFGLNSKTTPGSSNDYIPAIVRGKYSLRICTFHLETAKV